MMGRYFKPLRKKVGVVTLGLACLFAAGWVRSRTVIDAFSVRRSLYSMSTLHSASEELALSTLCIVSPVELGDFPFWSSETIPTDYIFSLPFDPLTVETQYRFLGFYSLKDCPVDGGVHIYACGAPYWSIVIPLTLLSAWLLLSKPRVAKPKAIAEPIPTEVA